MRNIIRKAVLVTAAATAIGLLNVASGAGAFAHDPAGTANDPRLVPFRSVGDTATVGFKSSPVGDAPGSPQPRALRLSTFEDTGIAYAGVDPVNVAINGQAIADVNRLGFKTRGYNGAGAPRISVELSNGHIAYLASFHCNTVLSPTVWRKTQFTSNAAGCAIFTNTTSYASTGTSSAWDQLVAGEGGGVTINDIYLVQDEGPAIAWVDDLRFGGVMFSGPDIRTHSH